MVRQVGHTCINALPID